MRAFRFDLVMGMLGVSAQNSGYNANCAAGFDLPIKELLNKPSFRQ